MSNNIAKTIVHQGIEALGRFYSLYRAVVVQNDDPLASNRLKVAIPGIQGGETLWALPRNQHGSEQTGFKYLAPAIGDIVYVSFEAGDPSKPLWEYHSWASGQMPKGLDAPYLCGFITPNGISVIFNDSSGTLDLYLPGKARIYAKDRVTIASESTVQIASTNGLVAVNKGEHGGVVNIKELTDKLNKLVNEVNTLTNLYNTHVHETPAGPALPTTSQSSPVTNFKETDYEDSKFIH